MELVSVTQPLSVYFDKSAIHPDRLAWASTRGTLVHQACAAYSRGFPVITSEEINGYVDSFLYWHARYVKRSLFVESEFIDSHTYGIKGHPDLVAELVDGRIVVVDYKTPVVEAKTWRAQLAAYCYLVEPVVGCKPGGMALMLSPDGGRAKAISYQYQAEDMANFLAALQAYRAFKGA